MNTKSITGINSTKMKFLGLFTISVILCVVVSAAFWGARSALPIQVTEINSAENPEQGMAASQPQNNFSGSDSGTAVQTSNATLISKAEKSLQASIDSIKTGTADYTQVNNTLALFREAIKHPQSLSLISDALNNKSKPVAAGNEEISRLKNDLEVKEGQIVSMDNQLKTLQKNAGTSPDVSKLKTDLQNRDVQITALQNQLKTVPKSANTEQPDVSKLKDQLELKDAQITKLMNQLKSKPNSDNAGNLMADNKKLMDENSFLKWAVRSEVSSNHNLTNLNSSLKQANTTLQTQVNDLKKQSGKQ